MVEFLHIENNEGFWINLGMRIKQERKRAGLTQLDLIHRVRNESEAYRLIGQWEKGKAIPRLSDMIELTKVFGCDLAYLMGEIDCRTRVAADIEAETGLTEKAIQRLRELKKGAHKDYLYIISLLIDEMGESGKKYYTESTVLDEIVNYICTTIFDDEEDSSDMSKPSSEISGKDIEDLGLLRIQLKLKQLKAWYKGDDPA